MNSTSLISKSQIALAFTAAIIVDIIQLPANIAFFAGALSGVGLIAIDAPIEMVDATVDVISGFIISSLIGFHWTLLPTFALEIIPAADALPTWTGCVGYVVSRRKKEGRIEGSNSQRIPG